MENINNIVATNLREIRTKNKLSLDRLSEITGVSKSMLGQIERGESSPTLQTIWKIASGLKISLTSLIICSKPVTELVDKSKIAPIVENDGKFKIYPMFPFDYEKRFEVLNVELEPGASYISEPHDENTEEFLLVSEGEFILRIDDEDYTVKTGNGIRFKSDKNHEYHNSSDSISKFTMVIYYPHSIKEDF